MKLVDDEDDDMGSSDIIWRDWAMDRAGETAADRSFWGIEIILG